MNYLTRTHYIKMGYNMYQRQMQFLDTLGAKTANSCLIHLLSKPLNRVASPSQCGRFQKAFENHRYVTFVSFSKKICDNGDPYRAQNHASPISVIPLLASRDRRWTFTKESMSIFTLGVQACLSISATTIINA